MYFIKFKRTENLLLGFESKTESEKINYQYFVVLPNSKIRKFFDAVKTFVIGFHLLVVPYM